MTAVVLATGPSLLPEPQAVADRVRHLPTVAVNDAFRLAPWATALVACDPNWWKHNPDAMQFAGEKWTAGNVPHVPRIYGSGIYTNTNSGLLGLDYCVRRLEAKRVLLLGIDMAGTHYFGKHKDGLANTEPSRFAFFMAQFSVYAEKLKGVEVINCSPASALTVFPRMSLDEALAEALA